MIQLLLYFPRWSCLVSHMAISLVEGYPSSHEPFANMGYPGSELHFLVENSSREGQRCLHAPPGSFIIRAVHHHHQTDNTQQQYQQETRFSYSKIRG